MNPIALAEIQRIAEALAAACGDDEQLFADMTEGESPAQDIIERLHEQRAETLEMIEGVKAREADLKARKARLQAREAAHKRAIGQVLRAARLPKVELPEATYSVRDGKAKIEVVDPQAVPEEFVTMKPVPNKAEINAAFDADGDLPNWLTRVEPQDVITARTT